MGEGGAKRTPWTSAVALQQSPSLPSLTYRGPTIHYTMTRRDGLRFARQVFTGYDDSCKDCGGNGTFVRTSTCQKCDGRGRVCSNCRGCRGSGWYKSHLVCKMCNGSGEFERECKACGGSGDYTTSSVCRACKGSGLWRRNDTWKFKGH